MRRELLDNNDIRGIRLLNYTDTLLQLVDMRAIESLRFHWVDFIKPMMNRYMEIMSINIQKHRIFMSGREYL